MGRLQRSKHRAVVAEQRLPGQGPNHEGDEEGQQDNEQVGGLARPGVERDPVGSRIGDQERQYGGGAAELDGVQILRGVEVYPERVVVEAPGEVEPRDKVTRLQRGDGEGDDRKYEEKQQPATTRQDEQVRRQGAAPPEREQLPGGGSCPERPLRYLPSSLPPGITPGSRR